MLKKKINTFNGPGFWKNAYAHQKGALLRMVDVPEGEIPYMLDKPYQDLPVELRYEIETSPNVDAVRLK